MVILTTLAIVTSLFILVMVLMYISILSLYTMTLLMGLRHALPDGLRSKYGVSRRIFTRCTTGPFWIRTVPFVGRVPHCMAHL